MIVKIILQFNLLSSLIILCSCGLISNFFGKKGDDTIEGLILPCSSSDLDEAETHLSKSDILSAYNSYSDLLSKKSDCPEAEFGLALTKFARIGENETIKEILKDFGQSELNIPEYILGESGFLAMLNEINSGSSTLTISNATMSVELGDENFAPTIVFHKPSSDKVYIEIKSKIDDISLLIYVNNLENITIGQEISLPTISDLTEITESTNIYDLPIGIQLFGESVTSLLGCASFSNLAKSDGGITFNKFDSALNSEVDASFNNGVIYGGGCSESSGEQSLTISGAITDIITTKEVAKTNIPFEAFNLKEMFKAIPANYSSENIQSDLLKIADEVDKIYENVEKSLNKSDFLFTLPSGMLFSSTDFYFNQSDIYFIAGLLKIFEATIYIINSYDFELDDLSYLFNEDGEFGLSNDEYLTILNKFFSLKEVNKMSAAKNSFKTALTHIKDGLKYINGKYFSAGTFRYMSEDEETINQLYDIVDALIYSINNGSTQIPNIEPTMSIDLKSLFDSSPSRSDINLDPFQLDENGNITANINFFNTLIEPYTNYMISDFDLTILPDRLVNKDTNGKDFLRRVLDIYLPFEIVGRYFDY